MRPDFLAGKQLWVSDSMNGQEFGGIVEVAMYCKMCHFATV